MFHAPTNPPCNYCMSVDLFVPLRRAFHANYVTDCVHADRGDPIILDYFF